MQQTFINIFPLGQSTNNGNISRITHKYKGNTYICGVGYSPTPVFRFRKHGFGYSPSPVNRSQNHLFYRNPLQAQLHTRTTPRKDHQGATLTLTATYLGAPQQR